MSEPPVTFEEPSYLLFDLDDNAVLMTVHGNLAIFNTKGMAEAYAKTSSKRIEVRAVRITPIEHH